MEFIGTAHAAYSSFNQYFTQLVNYAIGIAGLFSVLIFVYAGFVYSKSQGDPSKISMAKELVSGVIIGLTIVLLIKVILPIIGVN